MKKLFFVFCSLFLITYSSLLNAQGFTFVPFGPTSVQLPYIPDSLQVVQFRGIIKNTSASELQFRFARIHNQLPEAWGTQMCYDLCYAPFVDTISLTSDPPYSIPPNHTDTLFYIDFACYGQGAGQSIVRMYNTDNPDLYVENTFNVQVGDVGITNISSMVSDFELAQNYPNPFNPSTKIIFSIPNQDNVTLKVYDILGNEAATLIDNENLSAGKYSVSFDGANQPSGFYFYTLQTMSFRDTKKMILSK